MPRPAQLTNADLTLRLQVNGASTAQELVAALGVAQPTISRGIARLGEAVVALGAARRTRYALRRPVRSVGDRWPVYRVDAAGRVNEWARVHALHGGFWVEWTGEVPAWAEQAFDREGFSEGFPFFLGDLRPQGFVGRQQVSRVADSLRLPSDPRQWGDDDTLVYLQAEADDAPGNLLVGDRPLARHHQRLIADPVALPPEDYSVRYPEIASAMASPGGAGSSVEGEQPKFLLSHRDGDATAAVLVKYTDNLSTATGRRWADLLAAEAQALALLHVHGECHAAPRLLDAGGRRFLETRRYDRSGAHGRHGVVSLRALHDAFDGPDATQWSASAANLHARGLIDATALRSVRLRHAFGQLIGNSDMHFGNLAFWFEDTLPFRLAPAYDMLPMQWSPMAGSATPMPAFAPPPPPPGEREIWAEAVAWATEFWRRVAEDARVSAEFREIARRAGAHVERMRGLFA